MLYVIPRYNIQKKYAQWALCKTTTVFDFDFWPTAISAAPELFVGLNFHARYTALARVPQSVVGSAPEKAACGLFPLTKRL